jgi:hypothetical protein
MSYNGSGTFQINTSGQPVVTGTVISSTAFNALTADLATGLSTAITKDGQTTTTARIPFAAGINSTLATDSSSTSTGSIITSGGVGIAKNLYVGANTNIAGTLGVTGVATFSAAPIYSSLTASSAVATDASKNLVSVTNTGTGNNVLGIGPTISLPTIDNIKMGYTTTATAGGTTTLTVASNYRQFFTGTLAQTIVLPVTSTLVTGIAYEIENNSTGLLTVNSSGGNLVGTIPAGVCAHAVCIGTTLTTAADWDWDYISNTSITGTGSAVLATSPTITTPTIDTITSAAATALTLKSAGTTALTISTSQAATFANTVADSVAILRPLVSGTAVASTSGTSIDFTGIPSWVKRITVMLIGVSSNGASMPTVRIGDSGGISATGYLGSVMCGANATLFTTGFEYGGGLQSATRVWHGAITINLQNSSTNTWAATGVISLSDGASTVVTAGSKSLSSTLTQVRITFVNGTDAFDAGSINILYE